MPSEAVHRFNWFGKQTNKPLWQALNVPTQILSIIVFLPLLGGLLLMLLRGEKALEPVALVVTLATFLVSLALYVGWKQGDPGMQFFETVPWVPQLGLSYTVGVDGLSLFLVLLTTFMMPLVLLFSWNSVHDQLKTYLVLMLMLETAMLGVFVASGPGAVLRLLRAPS